MNQQRPDILAELKSFINSIPQVTRYLTLGTLLFSFAPKLSMCRFDQLMLLSDPLYRLQIHRLVTSHLISGGQGLIWHVYLLYTNSRSLEEGYFGGKRADYALAILLLMGVIDFIGFYFEYPVLTEAFGMGLCYLYSNVNAHQIVNFMFGFQFKAMYLPYVLFGWNFLMTGSFEMPLIGIAAGYIVYQITVLYPTDHGRVLVPTPPFLKRMFPADVGVHGMNGPQTTQSRPSPNTWGKGRKLGSE